MIILECDDIENAYMQFAIDKNKNQNVPLKAAAKNAFDEALKIMPEFTVATQNANAVVIAMQNEQKVKDQSKKE